MSFIVLANSTRVVLPLQTRLETPAPDARPRPAAVGGPGSAAPVLKGILVSQAKASGHCQQGFIELGEPGLPRPFPGESWCYEWRVDGDNLLACWLGFPNAFFSSNIDPVLRVSVEALGHFAPGHAGGAVAPGAVMLRSLARIHITVKSGGEAAPRVQPAWMPEDSPKLFPAG